MKRMIYLLTGVIVIVIVALYVALLVFSEPTSLKGYQRAEYEFFIYMLDKSIDPSTFKLVDSTGYFQLKTIDYNNFILEYQNELTIDQEKSDLFQWYRVVDCDTLVFNVSIGKEINTFIYGPMETWVKIREQEKALSK